MKYDILKRGMDIVGAAAGLVLTAPVMAAAAAAVLVSMGRPVFFTQMRPGKEGKPFKLVKFRTMRPPVPGKDAIADDALRLTKVGSFLRATSLDELPTLFNVLRGDMSLVGPRPLLMRYLERYTLEQARRHEVRPGVTGKAQVSGRNTLGWEEKFALDVWYVDNRSLWVDVQILAATVIKVFKREGISAQGHATMHEFMGGDRSAA